MQAYKARTEIDGQVVGEGGLFTMPGGPLKAIAWLAGHLAQRGRPLTKGQLISSGATTGIHDIAAGQTSRVIFSLEGRDDIVLELKTEAASQNSRELSQ